MHIKKCLAGVTGMLAITAVFLGALPVSAATLSVIPATGNVHRGEQVTVYVRINTSGASINAAQATISFPADKLQAASVDTKNSVFGFWLDGPTISNTAGTIKFTGGTTAGISGGALSIFTVNFKAIGSGSAVISASDAAITANDGNGTNILDSVNAGTIGVDISVNVIPVVPGQPAPEQPAPVTRAPAQAAGLPEAPKLRVPLYPDETKWYNQVGDAIVFWDVPADVMQVSARVVQAKTSDPGTPEDALLNGKNLGVLNDGIWYVRVQFKNPRGWGPAAYYNISIDTASPLPFKLTADNMSSDNPAPTIFYGTQDALSGIDHYDIRVDSADIIKSTSSSYKLPLQAPGEHAVMVRAVDAAGNAAENSISLNVLPIAAPTIISVSKDTYLGEGPLQISGSVATGTVPIVSIKGGGGDVIASENPFPDSNGNWNMTFELPNKSGTYFVEVSAKDARGALSFPVKAQFAVRPRPIFILLGLEITSGTLAIILFLALIGAFSAGYYTQKLAKEQRGRRSIIAERDVSVIFNLLRKDVDKMLSDYSDGALSEEESKEIEFYLKRMKDNLDKSQRYMSENVEEMKE